MNKIAVLDYNAGNLTSVETALSHLGADFYVTRDPQALKGADRLIFPGVGHAASAMESLASLGLEEALKDYVKTGRPVLGICLGSQIVLESSEESDSPCLGLIPGHCPAFPRDRGEKVPHMGWNQLKIQGSPGLFKGIPQGASVYFVHSYYPQPSSEALVYSTTDYILEFVSAYRLDNVRVTQFHPEKSGPVGLRILENFLKGEDDA